MQSSLMSMETRSMTRKKMRPEQRRMVVSEDRLTNLPDSLIDEIVSRLPSRSIACMSIVSKKWAKFFESCPGLFFDEEEFEYRSDRDENTRLDQFISKYSSHQTPIPIQKIRIGTSRFRHSKIDRELYQLIDLNLSDEIRELDLKFRHVLESRQPYSRFYNIPGLVFCHGVHLTVLELEGCQFGDLGAVKVPLLKTVSLRRLYISSASLAKLISASSSIESLNLQYCYELRTLRIVSHSLQRLAVKDCRAMETLSVDCPHLRYLECREVCQNGRILNVLDFSISCTALREVEFGWLNLGPEVYDSIFSSSPLVQSLSLSSCTVQGTLKVLPRVLKHLELFNSYFPQLLCLSTVESFSYGQILQTIHDNHSNYMTLYSPFINFAQLKSLKLEGALPFSEKSFETILSLCPQLLSLSLMDCQNLRILRIISSTLKMLSVSSDSDVPELECEIEAPNLISFIFEGVGIWFSRIIVSHELVAKLKFHDINNVYSDLTIDDWGYYVWMFNMARRIELSNKLTECVLVPNQAAIPPPNYRGQIKVNASLSNMRYKALLSKVLFLPICPTSVSLNLRIHGHPLSREPSALIDLKFDDHNQQGIALEHGHDCIQDHLYEASVEIKKEPSQALELSKLLLCKAWHLRKLTVLVPANIRRTTASRINHMKKVSENCEIIFLSDYS